MRHASWFARNRTCRNKRALLVCVGGGGEGRSTAHSHKQAGASALLQLPSERLTKPPCASRLHSGGVAWGFGDELRPKRVALLQCVARWTRG